MSDNLVKAEDKDSLGRNGADPTDAKDADSAARRKALGRLGRYGAYVAPVAIAMLTSTRVEAIPLSAPPPN